MVSRYRSMVSRYRSMVSRYRSMVSRYRSTVDTEVWYFVDTVQKYGTCALAGGPGRRAGEGSERGRSFWHGGATVSASEGTGQCTVQYSTVQYSTTDIVPTAQHPLPSTHGPAPTAQSMPPRGSSAVYCVVCTLPHTKKTARCCCLPIDRGVFQKGLDVADGPDRPPACMPTAFMLPGQPSQASASSHLTARPSQQASAPGPGGDRSLGKAALFPMQQQPARRPPAYYCMVLCLHAMVWYISWCAAGPAA